MLPVVCQLQDTRRANGVFGEVTGIEFIYFAIGSKYTYEERNKGKNSSVAKRYHCKIIKS